MFFSKKSIILAGGLILSLTACNLGKPPKKLDVCTHEIEISDSDTAHLALRNTRRKVNTALSDVDDIYMSNVKRRFSKFESSWIKSRQFVRNGFSAEVEPKMVKLKTLLNEASPNRGDVLWAFRDLDDTFLATNLNGKTYVNAESKSDLEWSEKTMRSLRNFIVKAKKTISESDGHQLLNSSLRFEDYWGSDTDAILKKNACRRSSLSEYNAAKIEIKSKFTEFKTLINKLIAKDAARIYKIRHKSKPSQAEVDSLLPRPLPKAEQDAALSILEDWNSALNKLGMPDLDPES
jgi:hypothetical protein